MAADVFNARLAQANLITKPDFHAKLSRINKKNTENKSKYLLVETKLNKLKTFDSSYFFGRSNFEEDVTQNYLVFQPLIKYFKVITNTDYVSSWKSKGLSAKSIKPPTISNNRLNPELDYYGAKTGAEFYECCLKQNKVTFDYGKIVNIYIKYEIIKVANINGNRNSNLTIQNALFEPVSLTKNVDIDKYRYSGCGIGIDRR